MTRCPSCNARYRGDLQRCPFDGAHLEPELDALSGTTLGRYRVLEPVTSGAIAEVYQAEETTTGVRVALKLLREDLASDADHRERFARELHALGRVRHRALPDLLGMGMDPRPWFAMPLYRGRTITEALRAEGPVTAPLAARLVTEIASALAVAHAAGVVHRDLGPRNVLLRDPDGQPVVLDFGLSSVHGETKLTETGDLIGTPLTMSPEQIEGHPPSPSMDHYALGCVWFELLTGRAPFIGTTSAVLDAHLRSPPPTLAEVGVLEHVTDEPMLRELLSKDRAERALAFSRLVAGRLTA